MSGPMLENSLQTRTRTYRNNSMYSQRLQKQVDFITVALNTLVKHDSSSVAGGIDHPLFKRQASSIRPQRTFTIKTKLSSHPFKQTRPS